MSILDKVQVTAHNATDIAGSPGRSLTSLEHDRGSPGANGPRSPRAGESRVKVAGHHTLRGNVHVYGDLWRPFTHRRRLAGCALRREVCQGRWTPLLMGKRPCLWTLMVADFHGPPASRRLFGPPRQPNQIVMAGLVRPPKNAGLRVAMPGMATHRLARNGSAGPRLPMTAVVGGTRTSLVGCAGRRRDAGAPRRHTVRTVIFKTAIGDAAHP
jgi:hypothetical protein